MSTGDINIKLHRPIVEGKKYDKLIPSATGIVSPLATGNTKVAIDNMVRWAIQHATQTKALAPKLKGRTIAETCRNIHSFLYNHIQYKLDGYNQNLRTPASTWANRKEGTDCKSYAIFGSTILQNLNIPHYFRRIKQSTVNPNAYTHVYIVVPKIGKNLTKGYFIIDGTIPPTKQEVNFIQKDDVFVSQQTGLGMPRIERSKPNAKTQQVREKGKQNLEKIINLLQKSQPYNEDLKALKLHLDALYELNEPVSFTIEGQTLIINGKHYNFIQQVGMGITAGQTGELIGEGVTLAYAVGELITATSAASAAAAAGTAAAGSLTVPIIGVVAAAIALLISLYFTFVYDPCDTSFYYHKFIKEDIEKKFIPKMENLLNDLNTALLYKNHIEIQHRFNFLFKEVHLGVAHYLYEVENHDGDECSKRSLRGPYKMFTDIKKIIDNLWADFKATNEFQYTEYYPIASTSERTLYFVVPNTKNPIEAKYLQIKITEFEEDPIKPICPYEYSPDQWLQDNIAYLTSIYNSSVANRYKNEVAPILIEIKKIRENLLLYSWERYDFEKPYQAECYRIYLKYDTNYKKALERDATIKKNANTLANAEFQKKLMHQLEIEKAKKAEHRKNIKIVEQYEQEEQLLQVGLVGLGTLAALKFINNDAI